MSDRALYPTRLWWSAGRGVARHDGVEVQLRRRPGVLLQLGAVDEIDYAPAAHLYTVQCAGQRRREMTNDERDQVRRHLDRIARNAHVDAATPTE